MKLYFLIGKKIFPIFIELCLSVHLFAFQTQISKIPVVKVRVIKIIGSSETGDATIFKTNIRLYHLYIANNDGLERLKIIKNALKTKKCIYLLVDENYKHIVNEVYEEDPNLQNSKRDQAVPK